MDKLDYVYGFLIGIIAAMLGSYLFVELFTDHDFMEGVTILSYGGLLGRLIKLGALLNLGIFFILLKLKKDNIAKGVIAATISLAIISFFV